jgi:hypothetical protein
MVRVVSMYKALTAVVVILLAIGSARAQHKQTESLLDNGQVAPPHGNVKTKPYDQGSVANPYDQNSAANPYSPDSNNNPYRSGSQRRQDSPSHFGFRWTPDDE